MSKIHLGCGNVYIDGWVNVDIFSNAGADVHCDVTRLPFEKGSADIIYASHVLEHIHRHMVIATLQHWRSILKEGGILRLAVPDFAACCKYYSETGKLESLIGLLYGGQTYQKNYHTMTFDRRTLVDLLKRAEFSEVREWDWKDTEHTKYDDYSQAFLPHMDKNGTLMSLNLEAVK